MTKKTTDKKADETRERIQSPEERFGRSEGFGDEDYGTEEHERRTSVQGPEEVEQTFGSGQTGGGEYRNRVVKGRDTSAESTRSRGKETQTPDTAYEKRATSQEPGTIPKP